MSEDGLDTLMMRGSLERKLFDARPAELSIGRFYVLDRLGEGGMGIVYMVYDEQLDRRVALKLLKGDTNAQLRERLKREARALAQLSHPNVVPVFEVGEHEGQLFIVLEYVRGRTLRQWVTEEQRPADAVLDNYVQAGRGLAAAHAAGIVHRDFKPDNAIVGPSGRVRVVDFGLARQDNEAVDAPPSEAPPLRRPDPGHDTPLTETGSLVGTPAYMAPEQFAGSAVDHRTDQFAFCVSLWEALCDVRPFAGQTREQLAVSVSDGALQAPPRDRTLPSTLRRVLERGLKPDPDARWASMDDLLAELQRSRRGRGRWFRAGLLAAVGAAAIATATWDAAEADADPCVDGPALLAEVWDDDRRARTHSALSAVPVGYAAATAARVDGLLSGYGDAWAQAHRDACEAALVTRSQSQAVMDQRMRCLDDRRRRLGALVGVLDDADEAVLRAAVRSASRLPRIASCADLDYVAAEVPPPQDEAVAAEVDRIADELARASALDAAGKATQSLPIALKSLEASRELGYAPLQLRASNEVAKAHFTLGKYDEAIVAAYEGFELADAGNKREAASNLGILGYALHHKGDYGAALAYRNRSLAMLTRLYGETHPDVAFIHGRIGETLKVQGKLDEAEQRMLLMLDILAKTVDDDHINVGLAHGQLGQVLELMGKYDEAIEHQRTALEIKRTHLGEGHPDVASSQISIGLALASRGDYDDALPWYDKGMATQLRIWGSDHPEVGATYNNIAVAHENLGELDKAREGYDKAREIWTAAFGEDHIWVAISLNNLGEVELKSGRLDKALANHEASLAIRLRVLGEDHARVGSSHASIGHVLSGLGRNDEALTHYQAALRIERAALGEDHPSVAGTHEAIGSALVAVDRFDEGLQHLRTSLKIYALADPRLPDEAWTHLAMGRAVTARDGCVAAVEHFERAATIWREAFDATHANLARPLAAIARCAGSPQKAKAAGEALARLAATKPDSPAVGALLALVQAQDDVATRAAQDRLRQLGEWFD